MWPSINAPSPTLSMPVSPLISPDLIAVLRCPETRQPLALADDTTLARLRGLSEDPALAGALIREDLGLAYPIRDGFPILLIDEAIRIPTGSADV